MKKILLIAFSMLFLISCGEKQLDGSSQDALEKSVEKALHNATPEVSKQFLESSNIIFAKFGLEYEDKNASEKEIRMFFNKKTLKDVISIVDKIKQEQEWVFISSKDNFDDTVSFMALYPPYLSSNYNETFVVMCYKHKLEIDIDTNHFIKKQGKTEVMYRFDDKKISSDMWTVYDKVLYPELSKWFLDELKNSQVMRLKITDYSHNTYDLEFSTKNSSKAISKVFTACGQKY